MYNMYTMYKGGVMCVYIFKYVLYYILRLIDCIYVYIYIQLFTYYYITCDIYECILIYIITTKSVMYFLTYKRHNNNNYILIYLSSLSHIIVS